MSVAPNVVVKTESLALAISRIMGSDPVVSYREGRGRIEFTPEQAARLRSMVKAQMEKKSTPSDVQIVFDPVINPLFLEMALPYAVILLVAGLLLGRSLRR